MTTLYSFLKILLLKFLFISPYFIDGFGCPKPSAVVQTKYGKVKGHNLMSRDKNPFYAFKGIPFAKPPVGDLRFRAPVSPEPWKHVLDAKNDGPMCIQKNYLFQEHPLVEGKEDCLYLNVYTPKIPNSKATHPHNSLLPVMVFIHYGAFLAGTGNSDYLGPEYFMDKDVILVTSNYRLGVFGFLSTNDDASPGNWAFKDQVATLKWVQDNIAAFGGDNKKVTIFGESAGAGSVHYHLFSPTTKNLFHRAISQSGSTLSLWARPTNILQAQIAQLQAQFVNCDPQNDTKIMVDCLRKVDAVVLADSADLFKFFSNEPLAIYGPVTETKSHSNPEPYITEDPLNLLQAGKFHDVAWVTGVVSDEGILRAAPLLRNSKTREELNANFNEYGPQILAMSLSVPEEEVASTWKQITNYFLQEDFVDVTNPDSVQGFINLYSDRSFNYGSYQSALLHAWKGHSRVWFYRFAYRGEYSYGNHFAGTTEDIEFNWGACHTDDLLYLFTSSRLFNPLKSSNDILMSKVFIQMWTDFAISGNPSPNNEVAVLQWNPLPNLEGRETVKNADLYFLNIAGSHHHEENVSITFEIRNDFLTERMLFWEGLPLAENIKGIE